MTCERGKIKRVVKVSILDIGPVIFGDIDAQIAWFQNKHLLANLFSLWHPYVNPSEERHTRQKKVNNNNSEVKINGNDNDRWRCPNLNCRKTMSLRAESFF